MKKLLTAVFILAAVFLASCGNDVQTHTERHLGSDIPTGGWRDGSIYISPFFGLQINTTFDTTWREADSDLIAEKVEQEEFFVLDEGALLTAEMFDKSAPLLPMRDIWMRCVIDTAAISLDVFLPPADVELELEQFIMVRILDLMQAAGADAEMLMPTIFDDYVTIGSLEWRVAGLDSESPRQVPSRRFFVNFCDDGLFVRWITIEVSEVFRLSDAMAILEEISK